MRFSKRYMVFICLLIATMFIKLNNWSDRYAAVEPFRGAALSEEVLYPLMSKNLNDSGTLSLYINDEAYENTDKTVILDDSLTPVASLDFIRDVLMGSAYMVDETTAQVQIGKDIYQFTVDSDTGFVNDEEMELKAKPSIKNGQTYIGLEDLCSIFEYDYSYSSEEYSILVNIEDTPDLPDSYDLRTAGRVSKIRNQGSTATCWACASLEALESNLLPAQKYIFSVEDMISGNSFKLEESEGGDYTMALAYLLAWQGPKAETDSYSQEILTDENDNVPDQLQVHLQEAHFYDSDDLDDIKWAVYRYGGVSTSIYASVSTSNLDTTGSYNRMTNSYCYTGSNKPNHDVVIIGWDDNYPASKFSSPVAGNGAFICQNSWGDGFGEKGIFYISYYDSNIGNQAVSYTKVDTSGRYSYIYQSDLCGWVGQIGYSKEWGYGANVFTAQADQQIEAAGFYALGEDTSYEVYFIPDFENTSSLAHRQLVASGTVDAKGYYTVKFDSPQTVAKDENFAILLYVNTPGNQRPIAVEYVADDMSQAADITDGVGFISSNGLDWERVEDSASANLCIKAYANAVTEVFEE